MGFALTEVETGRAVFECEPSESHYNPIGSVHGGVISTLLDSALSCAVHSTLPAGTGYTTAELKVNFVRPVVAATGRLRAEGRVIHAGGRLATAEARLTDAAGKLYAHAVGTCLVLDGPVSAPGAGRLGALAAGFAVLFVGTGVNFAFGILFKPILVELGVGRSTLALAATASLLVNAAGQPAFGALVDRFGPRRVILASMALMTVGTALVSRVARAVAVHPALRGRGRGRLHGLRDPAGLGPRRPLVPRRARVRDGGRGERVLARASRIHPGRRPRGRRGRWRQTYLLMAAVLAGSVGVFLFALRDAPVPVRAGAPEPAAAARIRATGAVRARVPRPPDRAQDAGLLGADRGTHGLRLHGLPDDHAPGGPCGRPRADGRGRRQRSEPLGGGQRRSASWPPAPWPPGSAPASALVLTYGLRAAAFFYLPFVREPWHLYVFAGLFGATFFTTSPLSSTLVGQLFGPPTTARSSGPRTSSTTARARWAPSPAGLVFDLAGSYRPIFLLAGIVVVGSAAVTSFARGGAREAQARR